MAEEPSGNGNGSAPMAQAYGEVPLNESALVQAEIRTLSNQILLDRIQFMRQAGITFGGARDEYEILGYDRIITNRQYRDEYARGGIAGRLVDALPNATWRGSMELIEDEDPKTDTDFEKAWKALDMQLKVQAKLQRADKLAGLSTYSVMLIGAAGNLEEELPHGRPGGLLYLTPFSGGGGPGGSHRSRMAADDFSDATIFEFEVDPLNPRFGLPRSYQLRRTDVSSPYLQRPVHWSRILHIAENVLDDEVYGQPTLERVWNLLIDLRKITGGGAEAFWLRANQGLHLDIDKDMKLEDAKATLTALKDQSELYKHQQTRWLRTKGVAVSTLGSDVANFQQPADAIITQIAGSRGMPKRILTGSEMGELASSQDRDNWKDQINGRQTGYVGPFIVRPLVDRLIRYGYLPTPAKGPEAYEVRWPHIQTLTEAEKAEGAAKWASVNSTSNAIVFTEDEIRDKWYGMEPTGKDQDDIQPWRSALAEKMAMTNKVQGATIFTDDEIRATCFGWRPLTPEQKVPITAPERVSATAPTPEADAQGRPIPAAPAKPGLTAAEDAELLRVLTEALEAGNIEVVERIVGLQQPQTFNIDKGLTRKEAIAEARRRTNKDFRGVTYDPASGLLTLLQTGPYKYGSTQVQLPDAAAEKLFALGRTIPDADIYEPEGGRETDAHVTVKYGLIDPSPEKLFEIVARRGPISFTLGKTAMFATRAYDVVYVTVKGTDLADLNAAISLGVDVKESDHAAYVPHATAAYVQPGTGVKYVGLDALDGVEVSVDTIVLCDVDGNKTEVSLA